MAAADGGMIDGGSRAGDAAAIDSNPPHEAGCACHVGPRHSHVPSRAGALIATWLMLALRHRRRRRHGGSSLA
jgi:hypothetical protein